MGSASQAAQILTTISQQNSNAALSIYLSQIENQQVQSNMKMQTVQRMYELKQTQLQNNFKNTKKISDQWTSALGAGGGG